MIHFWTSHVVVINVNGLAIPTGRQVRLHVLVGVQKGEKGRTWLTDIVEWVRVDGN